METFCKSHHEGAPFRNVFKAAAQKGNTATGKQANENSFKGKAQFQCRDMDHPSKVLSVSFFFIIPLHQKTSKVEGCKIVFRSLGAADHLDGSVFLEQEFCAP